MSEANAPFNRPNQSDPMASSVPDEEDVWANPFTEAMLSDDTEGFPLTAAEISGDKGGNPASHNGIAPSPKRGVMSTNVVSISPDPAMADPLSNDSDAETWLNPSEPTDLADLISLIQELNQCNSILLDRVSQLEEALERSQNALKTEMRRSHDQAALAEINPNDVVVQEMAAAHEQVVSLHSQLEFLHQTSQRQQILIETLTGQLESSQERIAQLEREAALVQQRYNEQSQLLGQTESTCRDLQARLHRQQRYTLQFKAALEKSLEVSPPSTDEAGVAVAPSTRDNLFLPKAQQIRPWSSVPAEFSPIRSSWMKVSSWLSDGESAPLSEATDSSAALDALDSLASLTRTESRPARSRLASVKLPGFGRSLSQLTARSAELDLVEHEATSPTGMPSSPSMAVSYNLQPGTTGEAPEALGTDASELPVEQWQQKLDAMVQPLADMLTAAVLNEASPASTGSSNPSSKVTELFNRPTPPLDRRTASDRSEGSYGHDSPFDPVPENAAASSNPDELLNSVMADAEDALWQDLARLIDVSTEDVVKASLSGDLSAFESINFEALQSSPSESQSAQEVEATLFEANHAEPLESGKTADAMGSSNSTSSSGQSREVTPGGASPCWPSPLVYPLRPPKKRRSLAAVDLPCFSSQEPGPLPT